jgi:glutamate-1-semialdehyde 2,1-aminomutase
VTNRYARSEAWFARGLRVDARLVARGKILDAFPIYLARADGAHVWDVDGNRYVDFNLGHGPVILGHHHPEVDAAAIDAVTRGVCIAPLWSPLQIELAELMVSLVPNAEMVHFLKTGSDAMSCAVRLCRLYTGRPKLLRWGYNGWHDWACPIPAGIPAGTRADTVELASTDTETVESAFRAHPGQVAALVMMPYDFDAIEPRELRALPGIARAHGSLFVLDEMRSGFRIAVGGAQERFGVDADVVAFSKAMGNGYAISAVAGRRDIVTQLARTKVSSSFYANPPELAAARATLSILADGQPLRRIEALGTMLMSELRDLVARLGVDAEVVGYPCMPFLRFAPGDGERRDAFFAAAAREGVFLHPSHQWFLSAAHTESDIEFTVAACARAMREAVEAGGRQPSPQLAGGE